MTSDVFRPFLTYLPTMSDDFYPITSNIWELFGTFWDPKIGRHLWTFPNRANPVKCNRLYSGSNQNEESKNFDRVKKKAQTYSKCAFNSVWHNIPIHFHDWNVNMSPCVTMYQGWWNRGSGGSHPPPPYFGRSVTPIWTEGADYDPQLTDRPPDFQTFRHPCVLRMALHCTVSHTIWPHPKSFQQ